MDWTTCVGKDTPGSAGNFVPTLGCVEVVFSRILNYAFVFAGTTAVIFLIWAGIRFVLSGGDPKQVGSARQIATYAIIGLIIILLSYTILTLIGYLTNVTCFETFNFQSCK